MMKFLVFYLLLVTVIVSAEKSVPYYDYYNDYYQDDPRMFYEQYPHYGPSSFNAPREVRGWGLEIPNSQVSGIAVDPLGNPVIFHRGNRHWDGRTFNLTHHIQYANPISENVVLTLKEETGLVISSWGADMFYLPHGITIDSNGNVWLTDVGLHQVFKFPPKSNKPSLTFGKKLNPGSDQTRLCKPSAVAVSSQGEIFIADGYCNSRILHFNPEGALRGQYGHHGNSRQTTSLNVPHGLSLNEKTDSLCIADRENSRVVCIKAGITNYNRFGDPIKILADEKHLPVFDVAFLGNGIVGIAGRESDGAATGFTATLDSEFIKDYWQPLQGFQNPHSIAVDEERGSIYVSEIGPNKIWKFVQVEATGAEKPKA